MDLAERWRQRCSTADLRREPSFDERGLLLGRGTMLLPFTRGPFADHLDTFVHDRMLALLAVAAAGRLAQDCCAAILPAMRCWAGGDRALAALRLAFVALPRVETDEDAYPLFLAETGLDAGLSPQALCAELGYAAVIPMFKDYRTQPRVPAGSGCTSGQWTCDATGSGVGYRDAEPAPAPVDTARQGDAAPDAASLLTPVFLDDRPEERTSEHLKPLPDFLRPESPAEEIKHGHPLDLITPFGKPLPLAIPLPDPEAGPGTGTDKVEDGPDCPAMQRDIPRGPAKADEWEAFIASLVNPSSPTPKRTMATPNVVSMAYYLPQPNMPSGRVSYDDCKRTREWSPIDGIRKGDMVDARSDDRSFVYWYPTVHGFEPFKEQVVDQDDAVEQEGKGRRIYQCVGRQADADKLTETFKGRVKHTVFKACHMSSWPRQTGKVAR